MVSEDLMAKDIFVYEQQQKLLKSPYLFFYRSNTEGFIESRLSISERFAKLY
ncbi:MAG: hypothetical protein AAF208_01535 [Cyanobacteria bacterium P01_A01_bin.45]